MSLWLSSPSSALKLEIRLKYLEYGAAHPTKIKVLLINNVIANVKKWTNYWLPPINFRTSFMID